MSAIGPPNTRAAPLARDQGAAEGRAERTGISILPAIRFAADCLRRSGDALDEAHEALAAHRDNVHIRWLLEKLDISIDETEDAVSGLWNLADDLERADG